MSNALNKQQNFQFSYLCVLLSDILSDKRRREISEIWIRIELMECEHETKS